MKPLHYLLAFVVLLGLSSCNKPEEETIGNLTSFSDCINMNKSGTPYELSSDYSCISYTLEEGKLLISHLNAGFNCCPDGISADIVLSGDTITIEEYENDALCDCNCLYNLEMEINNLTPGIFRIKVVEPYVPFIYPQLDFEVNLSDSTTGEYCVERIHYPWGI